MFKQNTFKLWQLAMLVTLPSLLLACGDDTKEVIKEVIIEVPAPVPTPVDVSYQITVTNLTNAQPLSPVAVVLHASGNLWTVGGVPSVELERMAEGGDNSGLLSLGLVSASGTAAIGPGAQETINITIQDKTDALLSVASMLVNTNDAFSGLNAWTLSNLMVGDSWTTYVGAYDAGTEVNSELAGTIPGPADGGEGFNPLRTDTGYVAMHPGVVTSDDEFASSVLSSVHKFDNPALRITVTRTE
jgi:hypothetical protein